MLELSFAAFRLVRTKAATRRLPCIPCSIHFLRAPRTRLDPPPVGMPGSSVSAAVRMGCPARVSDATMRLVSRGELATSKDFAHMSKPLFMKPVVMRKASLRHRLRTVFDELPTTT